MSDYPATAQFMRQEYLGCENNLQIVEGLASESTCRQVQCRFKRSGQYWSQCGDESLLCLETFWRKGCWHLLFPHNRQFDSSKN